MMRLRCKAGEFFAVKKGCACGRGLFALFLLVMMFAPLTAKAPGNVVALSKSVADMWLLAGGTLSGATSDALELAGAGKAVSVGTLTTASLEAIVALNPSLVIMTFDIPLHKKLNENLHALGVKTYVADVKNFSDYERVMKDFTALTGRKDLYKKNVSDVRSQIEKVIADVAEAADMADTGERQQNKTYLFMRVSPAKNKVLKEHFGNEIFRNLGLVPMVADTSSLDEISVEAVVSANPDYIFVVAQGSQKNADEAFFRAYESSPAWGSLKAVQNGNVRMLPKELFNYKPNARWAESYALIRDLL